MSFIAFTAPFIVASGALSPPIASNNIIILVSFDYNILTFLYFITYIC